MTNSKRKKEQRDYLKNLPEKTGKELNIDNNGEIMGWSQKLTEHYITNRKKKITLNIPENKPYIIELVIKKKNLIPKLNNITTYDEEISDDVELQIYETKHNLNTQQKGNIVKVWGNIEVDMIFVPSDKHMEILEKNDFVVDYNLIFMYNKEELEEDVDYTFVENHNTILIAEEKIILKEANIEELPDITHEQKELYKLGIDHRLVDIFYGWAKKTRYYKPECFIRYTIENSGLTMTQNIDYDKEEYQKFKEEMDEHMETNLPYDD
jgi:hypothetical protein